MPRCCFCCCCPLTDAGCHRCKASGVFLPDPGRASQAHRLGSHHLFGFWAEVAAGRLGRMLRSYLHLDLNTHGHCNLAGALAALQCAHVVSLLSFSCIGLRCENQTPGKDPLYIFLSPISPLHASARRALYTCTSALWHVQHDSIWCIERHPVALYLDRSINPSWQPRSRQGPRQ